MKQAAASPIPTVRELKANAGQKAAPSWVENQVISAPTSTILQGGRRTHDPVQRNGRTQEVGQETADGKTGDGLREQEGQDRHGLRHPELDAALLGNGQQQRQGGVNGGDDTGSGHLLCGESGFGHKRKTSLNDVGGL